MSRERALNQIVTLKLLAEDQRATDGERQAARDTMAKLRKKYGIPETAQPKQPIFRQNYDWPGATADWDELIRKANEQRRQRAERVKAERERAQRAWEERHANTDAMGVPLTPEDIEEARRDPLGWAAKQDKRTHSQKQRDLNDAWFKQQPKYEPRLPECNPKLSYFDQGGEPRERNSKDEICWMCGKRLYLRMGARQGGKWACCDAVPGPRKKKERQED